MPVKLRKPSASIVKYMWGKPDETYIFVLAPKDTDSQFGSR